MKTLHFLGLKNVLFLGSQYKNIFNGKALSAVIQYLCKHALGRELSDQELSKIHDNLIQMKSLYAFCKHITALINLHHQKNEKDEWGDYVDIKHSTAAMYTDFFISEDKKLVKIIRMVRGDRKAISGLMDFFKYSLCFGKIMH